MNIIDINIVRIAKALSDKTRLMILHEIAGRGSITCGDAVLLANLSQPTVSHHIKILTDAGLLNVVKNGRHVFIFVNTRALNRFTKAVLQTIKSK